MNEKSSPIKMKSTLNAWISDDWGMGSLLKALKDGDEKSAVQSMSYYRSETMESQGWVRVGMATVEVEIFPTDQLQNQQLATLTAQLEKERAESQVRQNAILDRISKLQALSYSGPFVDPGLVDDEPF